MNFKLINSTALFIILFGINSSSAQNALLLKNEKEPSQTGVANKRSILLGQKTGIGLKKNAIYGTLGTLLLYGVAKVDYERMIIGNPKGFFTSYWARIGYGGYYNWNRKGRLFTLGLTALTGTGKNHFEIGGGITSCFDRQGYLIDRRGNESVKRSPYRNICPSGAIGYRFQNSKGGSFFRTGVAYPEAFYISLGYPF